MGNCSGLFESCSGRDGKDDSVKRINQDALKEALEANAKLEDLPERHEENIYKTDGGIH